MKSGTGTNKGRPRTVVRLIAGAIILIGIAGAFLGQSHFHCSAMEMTPFGRRDEVQQRYAIAPAISAEIKALLEAHGIDVTEELSNRVAAAYRANLADMRKSYGPALEVYIQQEKAYRETATPLHIAAQDGDLDTVKRLVEGGTFVDSAMAGGVTPLWLAVSQNRLETAAYLLQKKANPNIVPEDSCPPLSQAAMQRWQPMVKLLLENGADVNRRDHDGYIPIDAIGMGVGFSNETATLELVSLLLKHGADPNIARNSQRSIMHTMALFGMQKVGKILIDAGTNPNSIGENGDSVLGAAISGKNAEFVELLIAHGADLSFLRKHSRFGSNWAQTADDVRALLIANGCFDVPPLHAAAANGDIEEIEKFLAAGVDVNMLDDNGETVLYRAVVKGREGAVRLLLKKGASPDTGGRRGWAPVFCAARFGDSAILELLLSFAKSDINEVNESGESLIHEAAKNRDSGPIRMLLEKGANPRAAAKHSLLTPLHYAAAAGRLDAAKLLIEHGAEVNAIDSTDCLPMTMAAKNEHVEIMKLLFVHGSQVSAAVRRPCWADALMVAVLSRNITVLDLCLQNGASVNAQDSCGRIPLVLLAKSYFLWDRNIAELLLSRGADANVKDDEGKTALHYVVVDMLEVFDKLRLEWLIKHGADVNARDNDGNTPLLYAIARGNERAVKVLLANGAKAE